MDITNIPTPEFELLLIYRRDKLKNKTCDSVIARYMLKGGGIYSCRNFNTYA